MILLQSKTVLKQHISTQNTNDQVPEAFRFFQQLPAVLEMQERENSFEGTCLHKPHEWQMTTYTSFSNQIYRIKAQHIQEQYLRLLAGFASCLQLEHNITQHESTMILHQSKTVLKQHISTQNTNDQVPEAFRFCPGFVSHIPVQSLRFHLEIPLPTRCDADFFIICPSVAP